MSYFTIPKAAYDKVVVLVDKMFGLKHRKHTEPNLRYLPIQGIDPDEQILTDLRMAVCKSAHVLLLIIHLLIYIQILLYKTTQM
jgi:hypothetical protein